MPSSKSGLVRCRPRVSHNLKSPEKDKKQRPQERLRSLCRGICPLGGKHKDARAPVSWDDHIYLRLLTHFTEPRR
ncbi:unnamed protein product [Schistocephalus solidus]|uniref:Uncharacterized protein n=1 Tax=Schistocephalus solidus TaxID=70667 RepID=A0A183SR91_SCHSO|nr:unnamed protein product [Schistocephalus solidus]